jgi:hypothetical protein
MAATAADLYKAYEEYSKTLRTWLVAYGIGAPVLFLTNETLSARVLASPHAECLGILFLSGVSLQVLLAALNKSVMWACYYAELTPVCKTKRRFRFADWISQQYWIDFLIDAASLVLFAFATWRAFRIVFGST